MALTPLFAAVNSLFVCKLDIRPLIKSSSVFPVIYEWKRCEIGGTGDGFFRLQTGFKPRESFCCDHGNPQFDMQARSYMVTASLPAGH